MFSGRKALIIDDSAMLLRYAVSVLGTRIPGLEVVTARRGSEGFHQADKLRPDLVLLSHTLPDVPGETLCRRLENHLRTTDLPVIFLCGQGVDVPAVGAGHANVIGVLTKPFTPEELFNAVHAALLAGPRSTDRGRARLKLPSPPTHRAEEDASHIVFRGTTANFSLKAALLAAVGAHHPGVLRFTVPTNTNPTTVPPTEVYLREGKVVLVTTRDPGFYGAAATLPPDLNDTLRREQSATGCPPFLALLAAGRMPGPEALLATAEHGQQLFARLWTRPCLDFEFERQAELPGFVRDLPPPVSAPDLDGLDEATREAADLDDWLLGTLRRLRPDDLPGPSEDGVPAYTREGYAAIRRLQLTDLEVAFARQVNGRSDLRTLAHGLGLGFPAARLLLFRFRSVGLMDLWPASALAHPRTTGAADPTVADSPV